MRLTYFIRAFLWISKLIYTLCKFWIRNPQESKTVLLFLIEKLSASSRFLSRNIYIEKHSQEFNEVLIQTVKLYKEYGKHFKPNDTNSYRRLDSILSNKTQILYFLVRKLKPKLVVETGVAAGKSTGFILQALKDNNKGNLYSIDQPFQWYIYGSHKLHLDSLPFGKLSGYLVPEDLKKRWKLILGTSYEKLPILLRNLGKIDMFFHDSEHTDKAMMFEYTRSWPFISSGGILVSDDISFTKAFHAFSKKKKREPIYFKTIGIIKI